MFGVTMRPIAMGFLMGSRDELHLVADDGAALLWLQYSGLLELERFRRRRVTLAQQLQGSRGAPFWLLGSCLVIGSTSSTRNASDATTCRKHWSGIVESERYANTSIRYRIWQD